MKYLIIALLCLTACEIPPPPQPTWGYDQCLRREAFKECMAALPAGPVATKYNDWSEVVEACEIAAQHMSVRAIKSIKPECRTE